MKIVIESKENNITEVTVDPCNENPSMADVYDLGVRGFITLISSIMNNADATDMEKKRDIDALTGIIHDKIYQECKFN